MEARYDVKVRNELTGEEMTVSLDSNSWQDAQVHALILLFKHVGWRKAVAYPPEIAGVSRPAA